MVAALDLAMIRCCPAKKKYAGTGSMTIAMDKPTRLTRVVSAFQDPYNRATQGQRGRRASVSVPRGFRFANLQAKATTHASAMRRQSFSFAAPQSRTKIAMGSRDARARMCGASALAV